MCFRSSNLQYALNNLDRVIMALQADGCNLDFTDTKFTQRSIYLFDDRGHAEDIDKAIGMVCASLHALETPEETALCIEVFDNFVGNLEQMHIGLDICPKRALRDVRSRLVALTPIEEELDGDGCTPLEKQPTKRLTIGGEGSAAKRRRSSSGGADSTDPLEFRSLPPMSAARPSPSTPTGEWLSMFETPASSPASSPPVTATYNTVTPTDEWLSMFETPTAAPASSPPVTATYNAVTPQAAGTPQMARLISRVTRAVSRVALAVSRVALAESLASD